ncbi:MAG: DUF6588 family protein [Candidatus Aminicenantaceae bacterium]
MKRFTFLNPRWKAVFTLAVFMFAVVSFASAQDENGEDLKETLQRLSEDAARSYVSPVVSAFGSNLNGGWFHKAPPAKIFSLDLELGLKGMGTFFPEEREYRHFSTSGKFKFNSEQATEIVLNTVGLSLPTEVEAALRDQIMDMEFTVGISGATIIGDSDDYIKISFDGGSIEFTDPNTGLPRTEAVDPRVVTLEGIGGLGDFLADISFLPFVAPQVGIGTILGTRAVFRYIPEIEIPGVDFTEDIGAFSWFGWGVQHNPGVFFPTPLPLDISVGFFKQTLKVGDIFEANTTAYGLTVSKQLGTGAFNITPYAGFLFEKSELNFTYDFVVDDEEFEIDFSLEGENKSRITLGLSLRLLLFNINADYNIGNYNSITVGFMFAI